MRIEATINLAVEVVEPGAGERGKVAYPTEVIEQHIRFSVANAFRDFVRKLTAGNADARDNGCFGGGNQRCHHDPVYSNFDSFRARRLAVASANDFTQKRSIL